jgi:ribokinase
MSDVVPSLCIAGNLNLDLMISGVRQLPRWGEEQFGTNRRAVTSGQAGYMGIAAARLGARVSIIGVVGEDEDGRKIRNDLEREGIDCGGIGSLAGQSTGLSVAIIREDGERCFVSEIGASSGFTVQRIDAHWPAVQAAHALAVVGIFNTPSLRLEDVHARLRKARELGVATVFDSGWDTAGWPEETRREVTALLSCVDLFLPNEDEALALTRTANVEQALDMLAAVCAGSVVIKRGAKGAIAMHEGRKLSVAAHTVTAANAVGAGDVYDAAIVTALQRQAGFQAAMEFASRAAEHYVRRLDDRFPVLADLPALNPQT